MLSHNIFVLVAVTSFTHCCLSTLIYNSSLEGAMELKFAPFCSSREALSIGITFWQSQDFQIWGKNHGL